MKKLNKLFAILFAVLGVQTLSAQTDVTSTYLTNAGFDDESGWITGNIQQATAHAATNWVATSSGDTWWYGGAVGYGSSLTINSVTAPATNPEGEVEGGALGLSAGWGCIMKYTQEVTLPAGVYTLSYKAYNANTAATQANNYIGFISSSVTAYGKTTSFTANTWVEESVSFVLTTETQGNISVGIGAISGGSGSNAKLFVDGVTLTHKPFADVTEENPVDLTSMVSNTKEAWTGATETPSYDGITMVAVYKGSDWTGDALSQTINGLPAGNYRMEVYCQAHSSWDTDAATEGATGYTYLCANEYKLDVPIRNADGATTKELYTFDEISVTDGTLKISVVNEQLAANWLSVYVKSLTYFGPDKSLEEANFATNIAALNALSTNNVPTAFVTKINDLKSTYGSADAASMTLSELIAANGDIKAVVDLHPSMVAAYAKLDTYVSIHDNSVEIESGAKATFKAAIDKAEEDADNAVTVEEINNVIPALEAARQTYVQKADPTNDTYFDYTFKIKDPAVVDGNGWTGKRTSSGQQYTGAPDNTYLDSWNGSGQNIYQEIANLPSGLYTLKAAGRASTGCTSAYIYLNDTKAEFEKVGSEGNDLGQGWKWYTTEKTAVAGTAKVGFGCNTTSEQWAGADDFYLYYYGFDVTTAQNSVTTLKAEAEALVGKPMNVEVATALGEAIAGADASKATRNELDPMIADLSTAIADAKASIAAYETIPTYIAKANNIDESIAAEYQTAYDNRTLAKSAETVFQELEVATYNYVTENFNYAVAISSTWNSTGTNTSAKEFSNEHWSGETRGYMNQNDDNGQGWNATAWSLDFDQDVTLPAGEYVFKVAGRKSAGATLQLVVTMGETTLGTVSDFPNGNASLGITKTGEASFAPEDPAGFANNGAGFGWQWRYVKFELAEEATVKIAVHAETDAKQNWVSFGDYTLQMTEDTYLEANKGALDAPTAAAEALVDTKPMGTEENTALKAALELPVTTGAELLAKIEALETAVANANAWVAAYNEAKAPLVAALERFETDYNDAENGALDHMAKNRWATAIEEAQAAAAAKDVTDSYEGFEAATANLVAALDAATVSVGEYADLKAAIDEANAYYNGGNWGDQPFQRPTSVKETLNTTSAQATYDAAEADGEDVTSVTEALNNAIDAIVLNAPEDGQRFYIKVATEGHGKLGNAVLAALGATGDNNPTGYGLNANNAVKGHLNQAFTFTQVEGNLYNISIVRPEGTVYLTYGSLNGSAAGWKNQQIQATTDSENKGEFKIEATTKEGVLKILNTVDNNYLDCQDGGSIYTDTGIEAEEFNFVLASENEVTLTISAAEWATLILPFADALPEGVKAYSCAEADGENLTLVEAESIDANIPYLVSGAEGTYTFTGYGMADKDAYTEGLFTGTYVDYQTTAGSNTYVLQNGEEGVAFYLVGGDAQPKVKAYRCYMTYGAGAGAPVFRIGKGTTSIDNVQLTNDNVVIYDLMGRKVNTMVKGGMYIVNGKKVVIK